VKHLSELMMPETDYKTGRPGLVIELGVIAASERSDDRWTSIIRRCRVCQLVAASTVPPDSLLYSHPSSQLTEKKKQTNALAAKEVDDASQFDELIDQHRRLITLPTSTRSATAIRWS